MTLLQLRRALECIPSDYEDAPVYIQIGSRDAEPDTVSVIPWEDGGPSCGFVLLASNPDTRTWESPPILVIVPGAIIV